MQINAQTHAVIATRNKAHSLNKTNNLHCWRRTTQDLSAYDVVRTVHALSVVFSFGHINQGLCLLLKTRPAVLPMSKVTTEQRSRRGYRRRSCSSGFAAITRQHNRWRKQCPRPRDETRFISFSRQLFVPSHKSRNLASTRYTNEQRSSRRRKWPQNQTRCSRYLRRPWRKGMRRNCSG